MKRLASKKEVVICKEPTSDHVLAFCDSRKDEDWKMPMIAQKCSLCGYGYYSCSVDIIVPTAGQKWTGK